MTNTQVTQKSGSLDWPVRQKGFVRLALPTAFLVVLLTCWEVVPRLLRTPEFLFPPFSSVVRALLDPSATARYLEHAGVTLLEAGLGLLIGFSLGVVIAMAMSEWRILRDILYPYIIAIQSMPKVALAPLFVIWFGFGIESKVVVVILLTFFPVLVNTLNGLLGTEPERIDLFKVNGATRWQLRWKLMFPNALPHIFTGLEIAVVLAMLGAIVGEFVGAKKGIGVLILQAQFQMQTAAVFALLIILAVVGVLLNLAARLLRRKVIFWEPRA